MSWNIFKRIALLERHVAHLAEENSRLCMSVMDLEHAFTDVTETLEGLKVKPRGSSDEKAKAYRKARYQANKEKLKTYQRERYAKIKAAKVKTK